MTYTHWSEDEKARLRELVLEGHTAQVIADLLTAEFKTDRNYKSVSEGKLRFGFCGLLEKSELPLKYFSETLPMDDYIISCDYHAPYFSERAVNCLLLYAQKFNIRKHIIAGDLFDMNFAKHHKSTDGEAGSSLDNEAEQSNPLIKALSWFDETFYLFGNHETRLARVTDMRVQAKHVIHYFGIDTSAKFSISEYDKVFVGDKWLVVHPVSYSQISGSVSTRLAEKYHRNVLSAHGHFASMRHDRSGMFECYDIGGMFDTEKIAYVSLHTTTHPAWNSGFGILRNGLFRLIDPDISLDF